MTASYSQKHPDVYASWLCWMVSGLPLKLKNLKLSDTQTFAYNLHDSTKWEKC
jgi:hypothetical protein